MAAHDVDDGITKADVVLPAVAHSQPSGTPSPEQALKLQELARGICERKNALAACARTIWLENGLALMQAKEMLDHGRFEAWCERELSYKKSTAENMIRAARVLGPAFKSVTVTLLPAPTLAYELSRKTFQNIRDEYVPRMVAGEMVEDKVWAAIKLHRERAKLATTHAEHHPNVHTDQKEHVAARANEQASKGEVPEREATAISLLLSLIADHLPHLMDLVEKAGSGAIFSLDVERELQRRVQATTYFPTRTEGEKSPESEIVAETADASAGDWAKADEACACATDDVVHAKEPDYDPCAVEIENVPAPVITR
ncbi:MAG: DUF3102 domain-containing protein [Janthinobacterium lividum]